MPKALFGGGKKESEQQSSLKRNVKAKFSGAAGFFLTFPVLWLAARVAEHLTCIVNLLNIFIGQLGPVLLRGAREGGAM